MVSERAGTRNGVLSPHGKNVLLGFRPIENSEPLDSAMVRPDSRLVSLCCVLPRYVALCRHHFFFSLSQCTASDAKSPDVLDPSGRFFSSLSFRLANMLLWLPLTTMPDP